MEKKVSAEKAGQFRLSGTAAHPEISLRFEALLLQGRFQNVSTTGVDSRDWRGLQGTRSAVKSGSESRSCDESRAPSASWLIAGNRVRFPPPPPVRVVLSGASWRIEIQSCLNIGVIALLPVRFVWSGVRCRGGS